MKDQAPFVSGTLLPGHFTAAVLPRTFEGRLGEPTRAAAAARFARWWRRCQAGTGPATPIRALAEAFAAPLFSLLGFSLGPISLNDDRSRATARATAMPGVAVPVVIARWRDDLDRLWREAVREGLSAHSRWTFCWNVSELRIVDSARPWGRRHVGFDLARCAADAEAFALLWAVGRAEAVRPHRAGATSTASPARTPVPPVDTLLDDLVRVAARTSEAVCTGLERGVTEALVWLVEALAKDDPSLEGEVLLDHALTIVYRILFLLFAEARALVPTWHQAYREAYTVSALCDSMEHDPGTPGLWAALQAISRLAHRGCSVGTLRVTPFNGHLFAPERAPSAERAAIADDVLRKVLVAVTTAGTAKRRSRISFADLGVEQLGAIYERVLDHRLVLERAPRLGRRGRSRSLVTARLVAHRADRKASATFYTPRALTDLIVRRTLAPLVRGASSEAILRLRVLDPAMGSGAFLVSACLYLARAYEAALLAEKQLRDHELDERERAEFRRLVARRCLYGVDRNPMAVQLARLSLWLATLSADAPLTFLDHHLRLGNSLVGASFEDLLRQRPGPRRTKAPPALDALPLLVVGEALEAIGSTIPLRRQLADIPDDSVASVRAKERLVQSLDRRGAPLSSWRDAADLWCAAWFWPERGAGPAGRHYGELLSATLGRGSTLPASAIDPLLETVRRTAARERFFHWHLEFPEVFFPAGDGAGSGGFDAILGNPPWDMVRHDEASAPPDGGPPSRCLSEFVRDAGLYAGAAEAHANLYLLFVDRALQLLRSGGRVGFVVPWGLAADHGASRVRRALFDGCRLDTLVVFDNRRALFPIHRGLRFLVFSGTRGHATGMLPLRRLRGEAAALDSCPEVPDDGAQVVEIPRTLLARVSGDTLAVPDLRSNDELRLLERLSRQAPPLSSTHGWAVRFGRELNATDDRRLFRRSSKEGLPVVEGKHVRPFQVELSTALRVVPEVDARRRLPDAPFARPRLAYRDVASATNARTLIAAVLPAGVVSTHTLFCCRVSLPLAALHALCALLNSLVANWMVRRWVSTHVTVALVERLPVPAPSALGPLLDHLGRLAERLAAPQWAATAAVATEARLQASAALAWGVTRADLDIVLDDFPLLDRRLVRGIVEAHERMTAAGGDPLTRPD